MNDINELIKIDYIDNVSISGLTNQLISFCVNDIFNKNKKNILIVTNSLYEANRYYSMISKLNNNCYLFGMDDFLTSESVAISPELKNIRINTLKSICENKKNIVITNLMGYLRYLPTKKIWNDSFIYLNKNLEISKDNLFKKLISIGYELDTLVTKTGQIATRGFIIDIFPANIENAIRIEFWGDTIDSIREFDIDTQKSIRELDNILIKPYSEFINEKHNEEIEEKQKYLPYVVDKVSSIIEYLDDPIVIFKDYNQLNNSYLNLRKEINEFDNEKKDLLKTNYMNDFYELKKDNNNIYLLTIDSILKNEIVNKKYVFDSKIPDKYSSNFNYLNDYIEKCFYNKKYVVICLNEKDKIKNIEKFINFSTILTDINTLYKDKVNIINIEIEEGFEIENYVFLCENELFKSRKVTTNYNNKFKIGTKISDIDSLNIGDYIVHSNHGIGRYLGIKTLVKNGNKKDYLELQYKDNDKLYIPADKIELISKYFFTDRHSCHIFHTTKHTHAL